VQGFDDWWWQLSARGTYFVTDHVGASLSISETVLKRGADLTQRELGGSSYDVHNGRGSAYLGLTYRFAGFAAVPGLYPVASN
jgi:hypothetical protein